MKEGIKIFVVEDEIITVATLQAALEDEGYTFCGSADEAEIAFDLIKNAQPDLIILDINLIGQKDGIWLAEQINQHFNLPFIFLTSLGDKSSIEKAIRTRPYGYLLKPFDENDVFEAIGIALTNFSKNKEAILPNQTVKETIDESLSINNSLFIKHNNLFYKVNFTDILFIEADKNYIDIFTENRKYTMRTSLKEMSNNLPKNLFCQISRSCFVNIKKIDSFGKDEINIQQHKLNLSENFKDEFLIKINQ